MGCLPTECLSIWEVLQKCLQFVRSFVSGGDRVINIRGGDGTNVYIGGAVAGKRGTEAPPPEENDRQLLPRDPRGSTLQLPEAIGGTVKVGLWGNITDGNTFNHTGFDRIHSISICSSNAGIHSILVEYKRQGNVTQKRAGAEDGYYGTRNEIVLADGEYINKVSGYYRPYGDDKKIRSLTFTTTNKRTCGSDVHDRNDEKFSVRGGKIVGFYGKAENFVTAIGFYILPRNAGHLIKVGPWGRKRSKHFPSLHRHDDIKTLKISHSDVINKIWVKYRNGRNLHELGGEGQNYDRPDEIHFQDGEYINKVIGYYGRIANDETINTLIFTTNRPRELTYGQVENRDGGTMLATEFSVEGGRIVGFHGTAGRRYVSSIGFYILP